MTITQQIKILDDKIRSNQEQIMIYKDRMLKYQQYLLEN